MVNPIGLILRVILAVEDKIVETILRSPGFHRGVRNIHRQIHERKHGRDPNEPLYQGEASADPSESADKGRFLKYFIDELRNQFRGTPTNPPPPPPKSKP